MKVEDQEHFKNKQYALAMRYIANAAEMLKKAGKDGKYFKDSKYVSSASGIAYKGVLVAVDAWLELKEVEFPEEKNRKTITFYNIEIGKRDKKLVRDLKIAYDALHLSGYYDGTLSCGTINDGFEAAHSIINRIKPAGVA